MAALKVHITGAYGLVGNVVYRKLASEPDRFDVYGSGRRTTASDRAEGSNILPIPEDKSMVVDVGKIDDVKRAVEGMDVMVHIAADPRPEAPIDDLINSNIRGTYNVLEACREAGVTRVVYASSIMVSWGYYISQEPYKAIYEGRAADVPSKLPIVSANDPVRPTVPYAASKVWGEALCRSYVETHGFSIICIRIGVVPTNDQAHPRYASVWCSHRDIAQIHARAVEATAQPGFEVVYGMSDNEHRWVDIEHAKNVLGYVPQDRGMGEAPNR